MLFRQLLEPRTRSLSYLVASRRGGKAVLVDPVREHLPLYLRLLAALDLELAFAIDTHTHIDRTSALGALLIHTDGVTAMGHESHAEFVARHLVDGDRLDVDGMQLEVMHTPGHTRDSISLVMDDRVFTGDTLLIRGTGRTDLGGNAREQYQSLFTKLLRLPGRTLVYPAHDYNGRHVSSIADERLNNPRLSVTSADEYVQMMSRVRPADPRVTDHAEAPSLRYSAPLVRELLRVTSALSATHRAGRALRVT